MGHRSDVAESECGFCGAELTETRFELNPPDPGYAPDSDGDQRTNEHQCDTSREPKSADPSTGSSYTMQDPAALESETRVQSVVIPAAIGANLGSGQPRRVRSLSPLMSAGTDSRRCAWVVLVVAAFVPLGVAALLFSPKFVIGVSALVVLLAAIKSTIDNHFYNMLRLAIKAPILFGAIVALGIVFAQLYNSHVLPKELSDFLLFVFVIILAKAFWTNVVVLILLPIIGAMFLLVQIGAAVVTIWLQGSRILGTTILAGLSLLCGSSSKPFSRRVRDAQHEMSRIINRLSPFSRRVDSIHLSPT